MIDSESYDTELDFQSAIPDVRGQEGAMRLHTARRFEFQVSPGRIVLASQSTSGFMWLKSYINFVFHGVRYLASVARPSTSNVATWCNLACSSPRQPHGSYTCIQTDKQTDG
jgi:hypothetical protein